MDLLKCFQFLSPLSRYVIRGVPSQLWMCQQLKIPLRRRRRSRKKAHMRMVLDKPETLSVCVSCLLLRGWLRQPVVQSHWVIWLDYRRIDLDYR